MKKIVVEISDADAKRLWSRSTKKSVKVLRISSVVIATRSVGRAALPGRRRSSARRTQARTCAGRTH